jgi:hypothetical protein
VQKADGDETNWIIETKGRVFDTEQVKAKDDAISNWCQRISAETGSTWDYIRINQSTFDGNVCDNFADLIHVARGGLLTTT